MAKREANIQQDLLDVRAAASLVHRNPETVRRWVWSGRLPATRSGHRLFVVREDVEALVRGGEQARVTLAEWAQHALATREGARSGARRRSAANLVVEDRAARAQ